MPLGQALVLTGSSCGEGSTPAPRTHGPAQDRHQELNRCGRWRSTGPNRTAAPVPAGLMAVLASVHTRLGRKDVRDGKVWAAFHMQNHEGFILGHRCNQGNCETLRRFQSLSQKGGLASCPPASRAQANGYSPVCVVALPGGREMGEMGILFPRASLHDG